MDFLSFLKENIVCLDGGMGTLLQSVGLKAGELPERWNISHPEVITKIHTDYYNAGSNVVCTNTFGANILKFDDDELHEIIAAAVNNARTARELSTGEHQKFIALDIGPCGKLLAPLGELDFEDAVGVFAKTVEIGVQCGVDLVIIETMNDSYETKAALLAVKENSNLPVIVSNAYGKDGKLMTGATPAAMVAMLEGMGADALGANCSLGPAQLKPIAEELLRYASVPVVIKPNAGIPRTENGETVFDINSTEFAEVVASFVEKGVRVVGGCCGTTPEYIEKLSNKLKNITPKAIEKKNISVVSSFTHTVEFGEKPVLIGERINPTGKKRFKQALIDNDINYILSEGVSQQEKGADVLDVNVGIPDIDEVNVLENVVCELQAVTDLPLQIDTSNVSAMEAALRRYNGKAMVNSVNGKAESMHSVFPLVKKYGGLVVALTLDENGIPQTAHGRVAIAKKILETASEYGIDKKDIIFDTLALTVSADNNAAKATLEALRIIKTQLGCNTSLGVSNVSFGLPNRDAVNATFFALALENGLSAAIINPYSRDIMRTYYTYNLLNGTDVNCEEYISKAESFYSAPKAESSTTVNTQQTEQTSELQYAVIKGLKSRAGEITAELLKSNRPLDIIQNEIIPALNIVGKNYERGSVYLPQLLMSAEAAKAAFEQIKLIMPKSEKINNDTFVIATVKGDIHDIGKNIVKLLLENYGFNVVDLGKDVPAEKIAETAQNLNAEFVGLSALMTTTVPAMEETIKLLRIKAPWCKILVGGAVLTKEYADKIGADKYAKDAMEAVRYVQELKN